MKRIMRNIIRGISILIVGVVLLCILSSFPVFLVFEVSGILFYIILSLWVVFMLGITLLLYLNFEFLVDKIFEGNGK